MCITYREVSVKRIDITVSEVHIKKLKTMSKKMGVSASEFIRRAIDEYWERFEKKEKRR
jgi:metal-responsive CopG/Arc/MetJ family transcriptional regulator